MTDPLFIKSGGKPKVKIKIKKNSSDMEISGPEKVIGDYDKGSYHMQGLEPAICKKFRNAGYIVKLINEFRTSKLCNGCNSELEKFHSVLSEKPKHKNKQPPIKILCHGDVNRLSTIAK